MIKVFKWIYNLGFNAGYDQAKKDQRAEKAFIEAARQIKGK